MANRQVGYIGHICWGTEMIRVLGVMDQNDKRFIMLLKTADKFYIYKLFIYGVYHLILLRLT